MKYGFINTGLQKYVVWGHNSNQKHINYHGLQWKLDFHTIFCVHINRDVTSDIDLSPKASQNSETLFWPDANNPNVLGGK